MKTLHTETNHASKQRGYRFWLNCLALLLGLPLLLYYGYCFGLWGRSSLLLQYLFQCSCPPASEEARYPKRVDVIVPACRYVSSRLSPSGRLLYVHEEDSGVTSTFLLDLKTEEKFPFALQDSAFYFLTDDLLYFFVYYVADEYILDRATGAQYPIRKFVYSRPDTEINGDVNLTLLAEGLRQAKDVFLIGDSKDTVIALASDFNTYPELNFIANRFDIPGFDTNRMQQFLRTNNIFYRTVLADFPHEVVSPDGRFVARADGIYLVETGQKIVESYSIRGLFHPYSGKHLSVRGWIYDGSGVIYSQSIGPCLIEIVLEDAGCFFAVPQPVLKLKVPEEYLLPAQTP